MSFDLKEIKRVITIPDEKAGILVVDDNPAKRLALVSVLESLDQNLVLAGSGQDALRLLLSHDYAVILLDVKMPDMDGLETAKLIRSRERSKHTPIIFVTSYVQEEMDLLQGYSLGAVDFVFTPIIPDILRAKVSVFVDVYHKTQIIKRYGQQLETLVEERTSALKAEIAEHVLTQERLHHLAHHDALTGVPNRLLFVDHLQQALERSQWHERVVAVLFLDADRFKLVNDTMGHEAGDRLLKEASARLLACVRSGDTVARFGGDEFAILLNDLASPNDIVPIAGKLLAALRPPFIVDGHEFFITGSIGISIYPNDGQDTAALLKNADIAMYRAKEQGGNIFQFYQADMNAHALKRFELETSLRYALERQEFVLHYQPQFDLKGGGISGLEALIRWQRPGSGLVPPMEFIPLLEETGLIVQVGEWALRAACMQHHAWRAAGLPPLRVAVNISARQFNGNNLMKTIRRIMQDSGMASEFLEIEITESVLMKNAELAIDELQEMSAMGVRLAIDDFGTGYSSLSRLKRFPIDVLKIDQTFVRGIISDPNDAAIVSAIITMAHALGIKVVAEGVETREQLEFLNARDCDFVQGYYFSRPLPGDEIESLFKKSDSFR
jgi:diguanylate cyclase (GGDEF)-like protein